MKSGETYTLPMDTNGFLIGQIKIWTQDLKETNAVLVADGESLNRMCHEFIGGRTVDLSEPRQLVGAVLFVRIVEIYQAVLVLASLGMRSASAIEFRALIEAYFHFCAIRDDDDYLDDFLDQFHIDKHRLASGIANSESEGIAELREFFTSDRVDEAKKEKEDAGAKKITTAEAAKRGGNEGIYRTAYALLSAEVHTSARSLESHLIWSSEEKKIQGFRYGPDGKDFVRTVGLSIILMCTVYEGICEFFSEIVPKEIEEIRAKYTKDLS